MDQLQSRSGSGSRSGSHSRVTSRTASPIRDLCPGCSTGDQYPVHRVVMFGGAGVGKSALCSQFLSSDHVNTYESVGENKYQSISDHEKNYLNSIINRTILSDFDLLCNIALRNIKPLKKSSVHKIMQILTCRELC